MLGARYCIAIDLPNDNLQGVDHQSSTAVVRAIMAFLILLINSSRRSRVLSIKQGNTISMSCTRIYEEMTWWTEVPTKRARKGRTRRRGHALFLFYHHDCRNFLLKAFRGPVVFDFHTRDGPSVDLEQSFKQPNNEFCNCGRYMQSLLAICGRYTFLKRCVASCPIGKGFEHSALVVKLGEMLSKIFRQR